MRVRVTVSVHGRALQLHRVSRMPAVVCVHRDGVRPVGQRRRLRLRLRRLRHRHFFLLTFFLLTFLLLPIFFLLALVLQFCV